MGRKSQTTVTFKVRMTLPEGATLPEAHQFVKTALICAPGGLAPEDSMFDLDRESVAVSLLEKVTKYSP
jgi:hypothetical protein